MRRLPEQVAAVLAARLKGITNGEGGDAQQMLNHAPAIQLSDLEKGEAVKADGDWWEYVTNANGKVMAEAWDLARNVARKDEG